VWEREAVNTGCGGFGKLISTIAVNRQLPHAAAEECGSARKSPHCQQALFSVMNGRGCWLRNTRNCPTTRVGQLSHNTNTHTKAKQRSGCGCASVLCGGSSGKHSAHTVLLPRWARKKQGEYLADPTTIRSYWPSLLVEHMICRPVQVCSMKHLSSSGTSSSSTTTPLYFLFALCFC
jgi:hypothetical protein